MFGLWESYSLCSCVLVEDNSSPSSSVQLRLFKVFARDDSTIQSKAINVLSQLFILPRCRQRFGLFIYAIYNRYVHFGQRYLAFLNEQKISMHANLTYVTWSLTSMLLAQHLIIRNLSDLLELAVQLLSVNSLGRPISKWNKTTFFRFQQSSSKQKQP